MPSSPPPSSKVALAWVTAAAAARHMSQTSDHTDVVCQKTLVFHVDLMIRRLTCPM